MILTKDEWSQPLSLRFFRFSSLILRISFLYSILRPLGELPLGPNTAQLLPIDTVLSFFPESVAGFFYESLFNIFQNNFQVVAVALVLASLIRRLEAISFILLSFFCFIFTERFFVLGHIGDYLYCFLFFHLAFVSTSLKENKEKFFTLTDLGPIIILRTIIYVFNIWNKLSSSWSTGSGFSQSLRHLELSQFPEFPMIFPNITIILNYFLIIVLVLIVFGPFISFRFPKLKLGLSLLCIAYHFGGISFFKLDGISIPFVILEVMLFTRVLSQAPEKRPNLLKKRTVFSLVVLTLGFFNITPRGNHFERPFNLPMGHNWYMFAPPPPVTGQWSFAITQKKNEEIHLTKNDIELKLQIPEGIRSYKYFYNLRRIDSFAFIENLFQTLCRDPEITSIKGRYVGTSLEGNFEFEKSWPEFKCD